MKKELALRVIFWISLAGVLFSGYLSYLEIFHGMCAIGTCRISLEIANIPACVYGFFMYLAVMIVSCMGIKSKK